MNTILACQDQYFAGGQGYDCPYFSSTSAANVDVSKDTWVSLWSSGLLDNRSSNQGPQSHGQSYVGCTLQDDYLWGDQLSNQMFTNKQLQDTLVQREEELARLHEENNKLKQYLNSTFVKCLEEKTKLLPRSGLGASLKRKSRVSSLTPPETSAKKAKRNLFSDFTACEEQSSPAIEKWVLQTLGLKDVNTIDDSATDSYSAISTELINSLPGTNYSNAEGSTSSGCIPVLRRTPVHGQAGRSCTQDSPCMPDYSPSTSLVNSEPVSPFRSPLYYTPEVSPNKTDIAFTTSLNPHCNVKTHSFSNGQAFVRRDTEGGWRFTWVPTQSG
ncbi:geminin coiled-coil domain-containing protein 1 isoform X2 [Dendrobates tinctorius]|uniref:geminin coiled-coil domain-containing protein 1 isoform X2 n=1 Tax=Dendrobates tinctorius TaxID=92724 RepID=UPI003CC99942